ncbi:Rac-like GTP-binding protein 5 [Balamuthia mandrillaris]
MECAREEKHHPENEKEQKILNKASAEETPVWRSPKHQALCQLIGGLEQSDAAKVQKLHKDSHVQVPLVGQARQNHLMLRLYDPQYDFKGYVPSVVDGGPASCALPSIPELTFNFTYIPTSLEEEYSKIRTELVYAKAAVILLCFSLHDRSSLECASQRLSSELRAKIPDVPIILVGTELHKRAVHADTISTEKGIELATKLNAAAYIECSGKYNKNMRQLQDELVLVLLGRNKHIHKLRAKKKHLFF